MRTVDLRGLRECATTDRQREVVDTVARLGSIRAAAEHLSIADRSVLSTLKVMRDRRDAEEIGAVPADSRYVLPGHRVIGQSTMVETEDGKPQWIKTAIDPEQHEKAIEIYLEELTQRITPRKSVRARKAEKYDPDVMTAYPLGDHHWGMYSYAAETGADYDLNIAKQCLEDAFDYLISRSPESETALFVNLGDALHINDRKNMTPKSGHILDVDSRFGKVLRVAAHSFNYAVERLLKKHHKIKVVHLPGNHDPDAALSLQVISEAWFKNEPRVDVVVSPAHFVYHQFGKNMICMTHGDTIKLADLPSIMAAQQPAMWGDTLYRAGWTGHVHHAQQLAAKEHRAAKVESFGVLPPNDAHGASRGYVAQREMSAIALRKSGGEMGRITYNVDLA